MKVNTLATLREMYETRLGKVPFPTRDCAIAGITDGVHGALVMFLADIAGIASHGQRLAAVTEERKHEFLRLTAKGFWERWPEHQARVTLEGTPDLYQLMADSEEARSLIRSYLDRALL